MEIQISIVIYNLIREICTGFLCKKHNCLPARRGHAPAGGVYPPSGGGFPGVNGANRVGRRNNSPGIKAALLHSWGKLI